MKLPWLKARRFGPTPEALYDSHVRLLRRVEGLEKGINGLRGRVTALERKEAKKPDDLP